MSGETEGDAELGPRAADREILERYAQGDAERAFTLLATRYARSVRGQVRRHLARYAPRITLDDADDIAQETLLRLHRNLQRQADPLAIRDLPRWMWRDVYYETMTHVRKALRSREVAADGPHAMQEAAAEASEPSLEERQAADALERCVAELQDPKAAEAVRLRLGGASLKDIAEQADFPHATAVHRSIGRTVAYLRRRLQAMGHA